MSPPSDSEVGRNGVVLSVIGAHAGEQAEEIFTRKMRDITETGRTFWLFRSPAARPPRVHAIAPTTVLFVAPATRNGARATMESTRATEFSVDGMRWETIPHGGSPVTGKLPAFALILAEIKLAETSVDLWDFADDRGDAVRFRLGRSTIVAVRGVTPPPQRRMVSRFRRVLASGRLLAPYAVYVR